MTEVQADRIIALLENIDKKLSGNSKPSGVLSAKEAAEYLNISYYTLLPLVNKNAIPHSRIEKKLIFRTETLDLWLANQEAQNGNALNGVVSSPSEPGYGKLRKIKA
jgi:excisionase family DNA binding protein